jgi:transposase
MMRSSPCKEHIGPPLGDVEQFFNNIKQCRQVATRYGKLAANYLGFVQLASIRLWLRANESLP